jgi:hypothetical protein
MRAVLLERNGKASSTKQTKHIKFKYSYIKGKVDNGEIKMQNCPMGQMWTEINTKPKQGLVYQEFRGHVMGICRLQQLRLQSKLSICSPSQFDAAGAQSTESIAGVSWGEPTRENTGQ